MDQNTTPYYDALLDYADGGVTSFHMPGHTKGQGASKELIHLLGRRTLRADTTQVLNLDDIHIPKSHLKKAQELTAQAYGADHTWFLVNGSTCGNQAMITSVVNPGDEILVPRNAHRSVYASLVMSGALPRYCMPQFNKEMGVDTVVDLESLQKTLDEYPNIKACFVTTASPYGFCADTKAIANACHKKGIPLLADEAWGPHFPFCKGLPLSAVKSGSDLTVTSAHKLLTALSQSSYLHIKSSLVDKERVSFILRMLQSTSPNCLLLASLDTARKKAVVNGENDWNRALELVKYFKAKMKYVEGIRVLSLDDPKKYDLTRVVLSPLGLGISGRQLEHILRDEYNIQAEMSDAGNVVFIFTPGHLRKQVDDLYQSLKAVSMKIGPKDKSSKYAEKALKSMENFTYGEPLLTPREAFYSAKEPVKINKTPGRICGELITPYPPGIPLLCPGEIITTEHVEYLLNAQKLGLPLEGLRDPNLGTISCITK